MPSVQRFLSGCNSLAVLPACGVQVSSVRASQAVEQLAAQRAGGGRLVLEGSYTGHEAAQIEVEIAAGGSSLRASAPAFTGVGNGLLEVLEVAQDAPLQDITLTCADLGIPTETACMDVQSIQIRARQPGAAGNAIRITVTERLVDEGTNWALPDAWSASTATQTGQQWDFGALPLSTRGEVPEDAPRLRFGMDPQVYRQWREYKEGAWHYGFSPALMRDLPGGARVWRVTGGYEVLVEDTASGTQETYGADGQPPIITLYDLAAQLAASSLVEVAGVVAADRAVGGMGAVDMPLRTSAWLLAVRGDKELNDVAVPTGAPTQTLTLRCENADTIGHERWSVKGDVCGALDGAETGVPYTSSAASFTIPRIKPMVEQTGVSSFLFNPTSRSEEEGLPSVCMKLRLGVNASPKSLTFRYTRRPPAECDCSTLPHHIIPTRYLGYEDDMDIDNPDLKQRLDDIYEWRRQFCRDNTRIEDANIVPAGGGDGEQLAWAFNAKIYGLETLQNGDKHDWTLELTSVTDYASERAAQLAASQVRGVVVPGGTPLETPFTLNGVPVRLTAIWIDGNWMEVTGGPIGRWDSITFVQRAPNGVMDEILPLRYLARTHDLDFMESGISIALQCLMQVYDHAEALAAWDTLWSDIKDDLTHITPTSADLVSGAAADARFTDRWTAKADTILLMAGILPKFDANSDAGGCWRDTGDSHWWADTAGHYMPAFTNSAYISCRRNPATGKIESTQEFGFSLVVACPERLKEGDSITVTIDGVDAERPYAVGDEISLQTVAGAPAWLAGGVDGDDRQTWSMTGSVSGALPDVPVPTVGETAAQFTAAGVTARLALGGIPHQLGDAFTFSVEAGQWRWRKSTPTVGANNHSPAGGVQWGCWSAQQDIPPEGTAPLADGLAVRFAPGAAPSFVPGDSARFQVHQPWAASHLLTAASDAWGWKGSAASATLDLGEARRVECVALAHYWLPEGAKLYLDYAETPFPVGANNHLPLQGGQGYGSVQMDTSRAVAVLWLGEQARYLRLRVENAAGGHIGWLWAGEPLALDHHASQCTRRRMWALTRSDGVNAGSLFAGAGEGWQLAWQPSDAASSRLLQGDIERLLPLLEHAARTDEPLIFIPHHLHPEESSLVRFEQDALEISDEHEWQTDDASQRLLSASMTLEPVYA